jgi:hypothetical protein
MFASIQFRNFCLLSAVKQHKNGNNQYYILPVVLYGCETWSLTLREGIKEKYVARIFGSKRDEVIGGEILAINPWH